jgi:hypothetical protein
VLERFAGRDGVKPALLGLWSGMSRQTGRGHDTVEETAVEIAGGSRVVSSRIVGSLETTRSGVSNVRLSACTK